ncbi:hypothetical protein ZRA01_14330 [Zoogloea ramigera]|uniref:Uncharacterized protein n=1 Tax=Zoogloea ramigera TaxID=350 RepID=A0A4Y4CXS0_ZOORA|nr:hypothetical protein ZRA01_14330 [Zoogloea ramigera]
MPAAAAARFALRGGLAVLLGFGFCSLMGGGSLSDVCGSLMETNRFPLLDVSLAEAIADR